MSLLDLEHPVPPDLPETALESLVSVAAHRAGMQPYQRLFTFLGDGEQESDALTFEQLDLRARNLGRTLADLGLRGQRVLLAYPSGLDFVVAFFGTLYAGAVAVPTLLPVGRRGLGLLTNLVRDADPHLALTAPTHVTPLTEQLGSTGPRVSSLEELIPAPDQAVDFEPRVPGDSLAMLQYTSGSTGSPKGVMLSHANLVHNQALIWRHFSHGPASVVVGWLPMFHDMGLIGNVMQPLYMGRPCILMSPLHFIEKPVRWLRAITRYGATSSGAPNFAYDMCVDRIPEADREGLDLRSWDLAFNGAEPIRAATLERFREAFAPHGLRPSALYPCYGMAEATLIVSGGPRDREPTVHRVASDALERHELVDADGNAGPNADGEASTTPLIGCGALPEGQEVVAVHPDRHEILPEGQVGEIWVSGPSVSVGYWRNEEATRESFQGYASGRGPFLRSGDLGAIWKGELVVTGRLKDVIIVRGRNHYPQDLEQTAESSHPSLRRNCSAAFLLEGERADRLALVLEVDGRYLRNLDAKQVVGDVRAAISRDHGLHAAVIALAKNGNVPKTSSGKVQRRACRDRLLAGELDLVPLDPVTDVPSVPGIPPGKKTGAPSDGTPRMGQEKTP